MHSYIETHLFNENIKQSQKLIYQITIVAVSSLLIAASAQVTLQIGIVPITLQTFSVIFLALVLGRKLAMAAVLTYIGEIFFGMPVMAGLSILNPVSLMSLGYIIGCLPLAWYLTTDNKQNTMIKSLVSNLIVYVVGTAWLGSFIGFNSNLLMVAVVPFIVPDIVKTIVAIKLANSLNNK